MLDILVILTFLNILVIYILTQNFPNSLSKIHSNHFKLKKAYWLKYIC